MLDFALYLISGVLALAMTMLGSIVSSSKRWHRLFFGVVGVLSLCAIVFTGYRAWNAQVSSDSDKHSLNRKIESLERQLDTLSGMPTSLDQLKSLLDRPSPQPTTGMGDLVLKFYGVEQLQFALYNRSRAETAKDPKYWFGVWNFSRANPSEDPRIHNPIPIPTRVIAGDFVHPGETVGNHDLLEPPNLRARASLGDQLFGFAAVTCSNCRDTHYYWLYFRLGYGGWYVELNERPQSLPVLPVKLFTDPSELERVLDGSIAPKKRIPIPSQSS
jgi:hypothetical protein